MANTSIRVKEAVLVTPSEPTPTHVLTLSALDSQLFLRFPIEYLFVYRSLSVPNRSATVASLKAALSQALVPYYPFAGRIRAARPDANLEVVCRAQGAVFIEAVSDVPAAELESAPSYSTQWRNLLSFHVADVLQGTPPLAVQLTWLPDGAAAVGVGINHCLCDGIGSAEFLNTFADLATGRRGLAELKPKPIWNRHLLDPVIRQPHHRFPAASHPEFNQHQDSYGFAQRFSREPLTPTCVTFDRRALTQLKKLATSNSRTDELDISYTSFEVLSAHIWRCWARALQLPETQKLRLLFSVNIRNKMKPNLPEGYYGNGFVLGCAQTGTKELIENGLGSAAGLIRRAKERVGDEYVRRVVESVSGSRACPDSIGVLIISQWSRLGLERVDLGMGMGKPVHVGPICCDRYCLLLPVFEQRNAVKVMVAVPKSAVVNYEYLLTSLSTS
ncbi:alcohol acyltransferase 9-like [Macadamia integrifolia]|uniref:alcohol acyltransferase 9-like n=1 Tax=Macadamia integrifolia TaxID=60698 RepID=UPI001C4FDDD1|nr:alcohol acyltransferase 9-like [Macadamia integrifolia]